jgi:hypothetical protein
LDVGVQFPIKKGRGIITLSPTKLVMTTLPAIETIWPDNLEWQQHCQQLRAAETLTAMVALALQLGLMLARIGLAQELNQRSAVATVWPDCPTCGKKLRSKGYRTRQIITLVGNID